MPDTEAPKSYRDPFYASLAADVEQRQGLPAGLLASIITHGERSNADQVSEAGARTVAQITPPTRKAAISKYGIDPYLSPENALEVAGLLLKDSLKRNDGDALAAVGEYHGGTDRANWGPRTQSYIDRVAQGVQAAKTTVLGSDFAKWMAENPATPPAARAAAPAGNSLDAGFAQWLKTPKNPVINERGEMVEAPKPSAQPDPSMLDRVIGAGEAALNTGTALTGGAVGMVGGTAKGLVDAVQSGTFGTPEGVQQVERAASEGAQALTYQPRTEQGQSQAAAVGGALQQMVPVAPLGAEMAALANAGKAAAPAVGATARAAGASLRDTAAAAGERVAQAVRREPEMTQPTPGTMGSVGAAGADVATVRRAAAEELGLPPLTKGQAERTFEQTRFEGEMAKDPTKGAPLRERFAEQNAALAHKLDAWVDDTGARLTDLPSVGDAVAGALRDRAAADKARIRVAYKNAEKAGELAEPVDLAPVAEYLNANRAGRSSAPILNVLADEIKVQGLGEGSLAEGTLSLGQVTLKQAEELRKSINKFTKDTDPNDMRIAGDLKRVIDAQTEGLGGDLYRQARLLRRQYADRYENFGLARDLMGTKRGTADAKIAAEQVFQKAVLSSSMADVKQIGRLLKTSGEQGRQAWAELQGAAVRFIRDEATKGVARDERSNPIVSPAGLSRAIEQLDRSGKLDYLFGKKGSEQLRAINDLATVIKTVPPGAVNTSNTASVILAALDMATSGIAGMPLPVMSGLRILTTHVRDRKIQKRIQEALGVDKPQVRVKAPKSILPPSAGATAVPGPRTVQ